MTGDYTLTDEQIAAYQRDGHIHLKQVATPDELKLWEPIFADIVRQQQTEVRPLEERDTYGKAFLQIINLWQNHESVRAFVLSPRFAKIAAQLMQVDGVRIYHDQALFKEPGGGLTPWHQDQYYWPLDGAKTITMWMPLVDVPPEMGALTFASGSHTEGFLGHIRISDDSEEHFSKYVNDNGYPVVREPLALGDATFHSGWTLHCAPGNDTDRMREVQTIIYFEDGAHVSTPDNPNRENDLACWLPGLKPGDKAASAINPVVWQKAD
ncbi:MAG: phytanoyl-CoA dioxygenase family protein [Armatimonadetes bacterium]|nr:phytanoyl-CoA dioxygenase family protein [Armatimonadota bacterium]